MQAAAAKVYEALSTVEGLSHWWIVGTTGDPKVGGTVHFRPEGGGFDMKVLESKPGELVKYFESSGARLGPHVNAYTSFDETVYMFDVPSDKPEIVEKALTALSDFAGGLSLSQQEVDKERGVVVEEWRGGLGAGSRIRDKQFPILFYHSRYADRLPIGKPDIIRNAPVERLRSFYDTWYRPDRMAVIAVGDIEVPKIEQSIRTMFGPIKARAAAAKPPDQTVPLHKELLVAVTTDSEVTRSTVSIERKRPRESEPFTRNQIDERGAADVLGAFAEHVLVFLQM
jgi:zinc protease